VALAEHFVGTSRIVACYRLSYPWGVKIFDLEVRRVKRFAGTWY